MSPLSQMLPTMLLFDEVGIRLAAVAENLDVSWNESYMAAGRTQARWRKPRSVPTQRFSPLLNLVAPVPSSTPHLRDDVCTTAGFDKELAFVAGFSTMRTAVREAGGEFGHIKAGGSSHTCGRGCREAASKSMSSCREQISRSDWTKCNRNSMALR